MSSRPRRLIVVGGGITGLAAAYRLHRELVTPAKAGPPHGRRARPPGLWRTRVRDTENNITPSGFPLTTRGNDKRSDVEIILLEASDRLGGVLRTTSRDGFLLEGGPDCFISEKPAGVRLCEELGLTHELIGTNRDCQRSFIFRQGKFHPVPEGFYLLAPSRLRPFLASSLLSWRGKWRVLAEPLIPAKHHSPRPLPLPQGAREFINKSLSPARERVKGEGCDESLASFVRRRLGREALERLAQPLLAGIYSADPETLSLRATFPQFLEMEEKYGSLLLGLRKQGRRVQSPRSNARGQNSTGTSNAKTLDFGHRTRHTAGERLSSGALDAVGDASGARYSLFVSLRDGMQSLVDRLAGKLPKETVRLKVGVQAIESTPPPYSSPWKLHLANGQCLDADGVCLALPACRCAELLRPVHRELADLLASISYTDTATVNMAFRESDIDHPLDGFGFVVPSIEKRVVTACTFSHRKFAGRAPEGHALLRAFIGGTLQKELLDLDDNALQERILRGLEELLGVKNPPLFCAIQRWPRAMPQYTLGHFYRILQIEEMLLGLKGLTLAGNWLRGVGVPDCIESAERAAGALLEHCQN